jgi:hypothetical protein
VIALCDKAEAWLDEKEAAQEEAKPHMAAKFTSTEVTKRLMPLLLLLSMSMLLILPLMLMLPLML